MTESQCDCLFERDSDITIEIEDGELYVVCGGDRHLTDNVPSTYINEGLIEKLLSPSEEARQLLLEAKALSDEADKLGDYLAKNKEWAAYKKAEQAAEILLKHIETTT